VTVYLPNQT